MIIDVASSAALATAISAAQDGDTIQLAAGEYSLSKIQNLSFTTGVTMTSADPNNPAVLDGVYLQNDQGLTFSDLQVKVDPSQAVAVIVQGGGHIILDGLSIYGTAVGDGLGVRVAGASNVAISNLDIHEVHGGITVTNSDTVSILDSTIHNLEDDAIQASAASHITISGNQFTQFFPKPGDHADSIQFFTTGTTTPSHDIAITDNTYVRGDAPASVQGIFMGNELGIPYENVTISGNTIVGAIYQGINVTDADNLTLTHNTVEGYTDINSWILIQGSTNATETDNTATSFIYGSGGNVNLVTENNTTIPLGPVGDTSLVGGQSGSGDGADAGTSASPSSGMSATSITAPAPLELVAVKVTATAAAISAPAGSTTGVILDANTHVWSTTEIGGAGNDTLNGGLGADTLTGGGGADHFMFAAPPGGVTDITDFTPGQDAIDLSAVLIGAGYTGSNAIADGYLVLQSDGADGTKVLLDSDGAGPAGAKYILHLDHVAPASLTAADFLEGAAANVATSSVPAPAPMVPLVLQPITVTMFDTGFQF